MLFLASHGRYCILIGSASNSLSHEAATRLFVAILVALAIFWLITVLIKKLFNCVTDWLKRVLPSFWQRLNKSSIRPVIHYITPPYLESYYTTALLTIYWVLISVLFLGLTALILCGYLQHFNEASYLFLQSLRLLSLDKIAIIISQIVSPLTLLSVFLFITGVCLFYRHWYRLFHWLSLNFFCLITVLVLHQLVRPLEFIDFCYPLMNITQATGLFSTIIFYFSSIKPRYYKIIINSLLLISLFSACIATLYLGNTWLTDVVGALLLGLSLSFIHQLIYQRYTLNLRYGPGLTIATLIVIIVASVISLSFNYNQSMPTSTFPLVADKLDYKNWWGNTKRLPVYHVNRVGQSISLFNIQYAGSLARFDQVLQTQGWNRQKETFLSRLSKRLSGQFSFEEFPLLEQLYSNQKPKLIMTYQPYPSIKYTLRLWRSTYYLANTYQPIWLGSLQPILLKKYRKNSQAQQLLLSLHPINNIQLPNTIFSYKLFQLPETHSKQLPNPIEPVIILIQEKTGPSEKSY